MKTFLEYLQNINEAVHCRLEYEDQLDDEKNGYLYTVYKNPTKVELLEAACAERSR